MKRLTVLSLMAFCACSFLMAQGTIKGKLVDKANKEVLEFVNVKVSPKGSEQMAGGTISDGAGSFMVENLPYGNYTVTISYIGYKPVIREVTLSAAAKTANLKQIAMEEDSQVLKEVEITGIKSQMKFEIDKKVFNVDQNIATIGGSASDILQNIPSIEVDNEGTVSLRGSESVTVWINGKAQGLTSDNQGDILEQMPAESIERIEVITNPSAKYSPEGTVGIINIVLKRDRKAGYYGSAQAGGNNFGGYNASGNVNYSSGLLDAYANLSYRQRKFNNGNDSYRESYGAADTTYLDQKGRGDMDGGNFFGRAGLTWHPTATDHLSFNFMGMKGTHNRDNRIHYTSGYGTVPGENLLFTRERMTHSEDEADMYNFDLGYKHEFSENHFIDFTVENDTWTSDNQSVYDQTTRYADGRGDVPSYQRQENTINNKQWDVQLDYENKWSENSKLEAGYKGTFAKENSPVRTFADAQKSQEIESLYNRFVYNQDLHALYATYTGKLWEKLGYQAGLRGEYYKVSTRSDYKNQGAISSLTPKIEPVFKLYPSIFLSYELPNENELQLNYTKRVERPWGGQLNSFQNITDSTNISFGNPELKPEYSNAFELNYLKTWADHMLSVSAYYRNTEDVIQRIRYQVGDIMYSTSENMTQSMAAGMELVGKNRFFQVVDLTTTVNLYYYKLDGFDYIINGQNVHGEKDEDFTWNVRMIASAALPQSWSVQLTGMYNAKQVIAQGYREPSYGLDAGIRKQFMNGKWSLALNGRDLLNSRRFHSVTTGSNFYQDSNNYRGGRRISATLTYSFGNMRAKKQQKDRKQEGGSMDNYSNDSMDLGGGDM